MAPRWAFGLALVCYGAVQCAQGFGLQAAANPIRKVVNMLKMMQDKVEQEGKEAEESFEKFMCFCKNGRSSLYQSIAIAEEKVPQLQSSIEESQATHATLGQEVKKHETDRKDAQDAVESAISIRTRDNQAFMADSGSLQANINAVTQAIAAIEKGMGGFLQTRAATVLRRLTLSLDMAASDRDILSSYLAEDDSDDASSEAAEPKSGAILGILKELKDQMSKDLADMTKSELQSKGNHESLLAAKTKEIAAATKSIEAKLARLGELAVQVTTLKNDLEDTQESLAEDQKFMRELGTQCGTKKAEMDEMRKSRSEELMALSETIKLLNDDDALDLFKKTLPSGASSFLQIQVSDDDVRREAAGVLRQARRGDPRLDFVELAVRGRKVGFDEVIGKIDALLVLLKQEQTDDDDKKAFCVTEIDKIEDEKKAIERGVADTETVISDSKDRLETVTSEITTLTKSIKDLDEQVASATEMRKKEHAETVEILAQNNAAKSLLDIARNRLNKFYNPKLYKAPAAEVQLSDADGEGANDREAEASRGRVRTKEAGGVLKMLDLLKADLSKQITQSAAEEKEAQADYEAYIKDSSEARAITAKAIADKEADRAEREAALHKSKETLRSQQVELQEADQELAGLHADCDWLLQNYGLRKEARQDEADSLQKARAVLSGADYSL